MSFVPVRKSPASRKKSQPWTDIGMGIYARPDGEQPFVLVSIVGVRDDMLCAAQLSATFGGGWVRKTPWRFGDWLDDAQSVWERFKEGGKP